MSTHASICSVRRGSSASTGAVDARGRRPARPVAMPEPVLDNRSLETCLEVQRGARSEKEVQSPLSIEGRSAAE
jgi:hypothetical protein